MTTFANRAVAAALAWTFGTMTLAASARCEAPVDRRPCLASIEAHYGLEIVTTAPVFPVSVNGGEIAGAAATPAEIETYSALFAAEFSRYPRGLIEKARLRRIVLCGELSFGGQLRGAVPDFEHDTLYLDVRRGASNQEYQRLVLHHDFFHLLDYRDDGLLLEDAAWAGMNAADFQYGAGGETAQDNAETSVLTAAFPGFLNHYSTTSVAEDKAEIFAHLLVGYDRIIARGESDQVVANKIARMKELLETLVPEVNAAFWQARKMDAR